MSFAGYRGVAGGVPGGLTYGGQASSSGRLNSDGGRGVDVHLPHAARGQLLDKSWQVPQEWSVMHSLVMAPARVCVLSVPSPLSSPEKT